MFGGEFELELEIVGGGGVIVRVRLEGKSVREGGLAGMFFVLCECYC